MDTYKFLFGKHEYDFMGNIWWGGVLSGGSVSPLLKSRPCVFLQRTLGARSCWSGTAACAGGAGVHVCALLAVLADPRVLCNPLLSGKIPQEQILRERTNTASRPQLISSKSHEFRSSKYTCRNPGWLLSFELGHWVLVGASVLSSSPPPFNNCSAFCLSVWVCRA